MQVIQWDSCKIDKYKKYINILNFLIKKTKQTFYQDKFKILSGNLRETWKLLNSLTKRESICVQIDSFTENGNKIINKSDIATKFNEYFVNIGRSLATKI